MPDSGSTGAAERLAEAIGGALLDEKLAASEYAIFHVNEWNAKVDAVARAALAALQQEPEECDCPPSPSGDHTEACLAASREGGPPLTPEEVEGGANAIERLSQYEHVPATARNVARWLRALAEKGRSGGRDERRGAGN